MNIRAGCAEFGFRTGGPLIRSFATRRNVLRFEMSNNPAQRAREEQGSRGAVLLVVSGADSAVSAVGRSIASITADGETLITTLPDNFPRLRLEGFHVVSFTRRGVGFVCRLQKKGARTRPDPHATIVIFHCSEIEALRPDSL